MAERTGTWAVVTGASGGMGMDFAKELAKTGYHLVITARREKELQELKYSLETSYEGTKIVIVSGDLSEGQTREKLLEATAQLPVDILVNNAGFGAYGDFDGITPGKEEAMLALNVVALSALTRAFASRMKTSGRGRILQTASIAAFQPCPLYATYGASKAFVLSYGLAVREELRGSGVSLTVLCPGVTRTGFFDSAEQKRLSSFQKNGMMESAVVARGALKALFRGKAVYVPGAFNAINAFFTRFVPRTTAARLARSLMSA